MIRRESGLGPVIAVAIISIGSQSQSAQDRELCKRIVNGESGCVQMTPIRSGDIQCNMRSCDIF